MGCVLSQSADNILKLDFKTCSAGMMETPFTTCTERSDERQPQISFCTAAGLSPLTQRMAAASIQGDLLLSGIFSQSGSSLSSSC